MRPHRMLVLVCSLAPLVASLACGGGTSVESVALPMQDHWDAGNALQHAMARGDLATARRAAARIADVEAIPGLTWDAGPYLEQMRREAKRVRDAAHFEDAAVAAGRMGAACGSCHARGDVGPQPDGATTTPTAADDTRAHMIHHVWAMDRMWEGLVVPSTDRWRAGARVLAEQPVSAEGVSADVALLAALVHEMGRQALTDRTPEDRAERFGRILTDCAGCHAELGVR